ncbi:hypothetical protein [Nitrosomonas sp.]|uniref:hypothetical protein n=1 Tax=Nitrosomonas sp. TaxID=42353 RepID=UPI00208D8C68|nr:hypothetical protein [Nitrosomonas sp.]GJL75783.1 MAG: hypothetical protein NMNS02_18890 [Nitrosomonas sp.]
MKNWLFISLKTSSIMLLSLFLYSLGWTQSTSDAGITSQKKQFESIKSGESTFDTITPASANTKSEVTPLKLTKELALKTSVPNIDGPSSWGEVESQYVVTFEEWAEETGFEPTQQERAERDEKGAYMGVADRPVIHKNLNIIETPQEVLDAYQTEKQNLQSRGVDTPQAVVAALWRHGLLLKGDPVTREHLTALIGEPDPNLPAEFEVSRSMLAAQPNQVTRFDGALAQAKPQKSGSSDTTSPPQGKPNTGDTLQPPKPGKGQDGPRISGTDESTPAPPEEPPTFQGEPMVQKKCIATVYAFMSRVGSHGPNNLSTAVKNKSATDRSDGAKEAAFYLVFELIPKRKDHCSDTDGANLKKLTLDGSITMNASAGVVEGVSASATGQAELSGFIKGGSKAQGHERWDWSDTVKRDVSVRIGVKDVKSETVKEIRGGGKLIPGGGIAEGSGGFRENKSWSSDSGAVTTDASATATFSAADWGLRIADFQRDLEVRLSAKLLTSISKVQEEGGLTGSSKGSADQTSSGRVDLRFVGKGLDCSPVGNIEIKYCGYKSDEHQKNSSAAPGKSGDSSSSTGSGSINIQSAGQTGNSNTLPPPEEPGAFHGEPTERPAECPEDPKEFSFKYAFSGKQATDDNLKGFELVCTYRHDDPNNHSAVQAALKMEGTIYIVRQLERVIRVETGTNAEKFANSTVSKVTVPGIKQDEFKQAKWTTYLNQNFGKKDGVCFACHSLERIKGTAPLAQDYDINHDAEIEHYIFIPRKFTDESGTTHFDEEVHEILGRVRDQINGHSDTKQIVRRSARGNLSPLTTKDRRIKVIKGLRNTYAPFIRNR